MNKLLVIGAVVIIAVLVVSSTVVLIGGGVSVPVYPGATATSLPSEFQWLSSQGFQNSAYTTTASSDNVMDWYSASMTADGWENALVRSVYDNVNVVVYQKDNSATVVFENKGVLVLSSGDKTLLTAAVTSYIPKLVMYFQEFDEMNIYVDENGDATGQAFLRMPPSEFSSFLKLVVALMGSEVVQRDYSESVRRSFARYGLEVDNITLTISTSGDNFEVEIDWESPRVARRTADGWEFTLSWIDNEGAAKETVAEQELSWVMMGSIAEQYQYDMANFQNTYRMSIVMPSSAENVSTAALGSTQTIEFGGGSHSTSTVASIQVDGRPAIVESGQTVILTENEFTLSAQDFIENSTVYTINYTGVTQQDQTFLGSLERVRLDLKYGLSLSDSYTVYSEGTAYSLTPAQLLYYAAKAIVTENGGQQFSINSVTSVENAENESGDWGAFWENLTKEQYFQLVQQVVDNITSDGRAPGTISTPVGDIRFRDALYNFLRILATYRDNGNFPDVVVLAPTPSGDLNWGGYTMQAKDAYYLLPDTYVITNTEAVNAILENFSGLDNRNLAENICNWTGSNLSYGLSFVPPHSENTLTTRTGQCRDYVNVYLALARTAGLPARRMTGWVTSTWQPPAGWGFTSTTTSSGQTVALHAWAQVYVPGDGWLPLEPQSKGPSLYLGSLPYSPYRELEQTWVGALAGFEASGGSL
jgi:transglutaminase-like putative cysteine protease